METTIVGSDTLTRLTPVLAMTRSLRSRNDKLSAATGMTTSTAVLATT
ncbi:hypothetical protein [Rosistilla oblonga]